MQFNLHVRKDITTMGKKPQFIEIDGILVPPTFNPDVFRTSFSPGKQDVIVATFPKCGTTWLLQIVLLILNRGRPPLTTEEYFQSHFWIEISEKEELKRMRPPRCFKTHLPFDRIVFSKEAKYLYLARHPADCLVSFYHHTKYFPQYFFSEGSFEVFFDLFVEGKTEYNDYFDHLIPWYEHRNEPNVFFSTFETLKADHRGTVLKIAEFLGEEYRQSLIENDEEVLVKVLLYSSFEYMKSTINVFINEAFLNPPSEEAQQSSRVLKNLARVLKKAALEGHMTNGAFVRKGAVGDGRTFLSQEQQTRLKARILEKTSSLDVMDLWKDFKF